MLNSIEVPFLGNTSLACPSFSGLASLTGNISLAQSSIPGLRSSEDMSLPSSPLTPASVDEEDGLSDPESEDTTYAADRRRSPHLVLPQHPRPRLCTALPIPPPPPPPPGGGGNCPRLAESTGNRRRRRALRRAAPLGNVVDEPQPVEPEQAPEGPIPENQPLSQEALNILSTVAIAAQAIIAPPNLETNIFLKASEILERSMAGVNSQEKDFDTLPSGVSLNDLGGKIREKEVLEVTADFSAMLALLRWRLKLEWYVLFLILDSPLMMFHNAALYSRADVVLPKSLRQK